MQSWQVKATVLRQGRLEFAETFGRSPITIGGLPHSDIVLADPLVSGEHAWVTVSRGKVTYHDRSTNGSFVDDRRIETQELESNVAVSVPPFQLHFELIFTGEARRTALGDTAEMLASPEIVSSPPATPISGPVHSVGSPQAVTTRLPDPAQLAPIYLRVKEPAELRGRHQRLSGDLIRLGRSDEAQLQFDLPTVSRLHAVLSRDSLGWMVEDLKSANGTHVNGRLVETARLELGDELILGRDLTMELTDQAGGEHGAKDSAPKRSPTAQESTDVSQLKIAERRVAGEPAILVLELSGRVDGYNYSELAERLDRAIDSRERFLIVDFATLEFIDHTGLGALVNAAARLDRVKGHLRLIGIGPQLRDAFELSRLDSLFSGKVAPDEKAAARDLAPYCRGRSRRARWKRT